MVEPEEVFDLLADEYSRAILAHAYRDPMSAQEIAEVCDAHHSTIYRRIETLEGLGLLTDSIRVDPDGHHSTEYRTRLEGVSVSE
ncbi:MAG: helix-turn-helix domain-containing protein [Natrialbaceae archaeon]|nr:helix-turn-helix domain-containing protein [Natrialbaceae archaeon]